MRVFGVPFHTIEHRIMEEDEVVAKEINNFPDAVGLFLAIIFICNLENNCVNTFGFPQKFSLTSILNVKKI